MSHLVGYAGRPELRPPITTLDSRSLRPSGWRVGGLLVSLSAVPALMGVVRLVELAQGAAVTEANARFVAMPLPVVMHIVCALPYSILGALLLAPELRRRYLRWHRAAGRVLFVLGMGAALSGLWMTQVYPWPQGDGYLLYLLRLGFGSAMVASLVLAVDAIRRRNFAAHGAWMIRAYAIGVGAGTQALTQIPWFFLVGRPEGLSRAVLMGAGWIINLVVAEWVIRRPRPGAGRASHVTGAAVALEGA